MNLPTDQIEELKDLYGPVSAVEEAGVPYVLLTGVQLPSGCTPVTSDLLLCPVAHSGYDTRLFFPQQISAPRTPNWNGNLRLCERNWVAYSWKVPDGTTLRLAQMVQAHLKALR